MKVLWLQEVEDLSEALRQEIDVELWGSTVESRAKFVETKISKIENELRSLRNAVAIEVEVLKAISTPENAGGGIPTVSAKRRDAIFLKNQDEAFKHNHYHHLFFRDRFYCV